MAHLKGQKEEIIGNLDPKFWVQKADPLVAMKSVPFSLGELKILDVYISRINAADDSRRTVIFTKAEYEELMGITCANYRALEKYTAGMLGKVVTLRMPDKGYLQFVLFTEAYCHKDEYGRSVIELTCTDKAKDLFFCIGKYHYFRYALENIISLTRKASYLLYLYIRANRYRGKWEISVKELRDTVLDCKKLESYQVFKEFKRAVLDPAVKEINAKTDCHFGYEAVKIGRMVAKIRFTYYAQEQDEEQPALENLMPVPQLPDRSNDDSGDLPIAKYGSERLAILASACCYEFDKPQMEVISSVLRRTNIPEDHLIQDLTWGRQAYLRGKYAKLNAEEARKQRNGEKPIKDRFLYFLAILEEETFEPAAY